MPSSDRAAFAVTLAKDAGRLALHYYSRPESLLVESKGHQDLVSEADREVETFMRRALTARFPEDGIIGEEHAPIVGRSNFTWVIDPIDGTANFVRGIPQWCILIACCSEDATELAVTHVPVTGETYHAERGRGAFCDAIPISVAKAGYIAEGVVAVDICSRAKAANLISVIGGVVAAGGLFYRSGSGGLMLAYVASGRFLGYVEEHMQPWDCMAGLLLIEEAGGTVLRPNPATVLHDGAMVIAAATGIYDELLGLCAEPFHLSAQACAR
jgi:myo-inositol-1(or 4)-monophosphatase